jgi:cytochrome c biogenesis protein CcdA
VGWRALPAALLAAVVLVATLLLAAVAGPTGGAPGRWLAATSAGLGRGLDGVGAALPLGYAFAAGMLAAVNPCGFVLLPASLSLHLGTGLPTPRWRLALRALGVSVAVTGGFVVLFTAAGLLLGGLGAAIVRSLPWLGLAVGIVLVAAGALALVGGWFPSLAAGERLAGRLQPAAQRRGLLASAAYGVAYGLASLGCVLPIFLSVVGGAVTQGPAAAIGVFVLYGLGLGAVLSVASVAAAVVGTGVVGRLRPVGRLVPPAGAALLILAGAYVTYYWLTAGGLLAGLEPA